MATNQQTMSLFITYVNALTDCGNDNQSSESTLANSRPTREADNNEVPDSESQSSSSFSTCSTVETTKQQQFPFELIYEVFKFVSESDCPRILYRLPWLYHFCTKERHKYWKKKQYRNLVNRDTQCGAMNIRQFCECRRAFDFFSHANFQEISGSWRHDDRSGDIRLSVRLPTRHRQPHLNRMLLDNANQIITAFHLHTFNIWDQLDTLPNGTQHLTFSFLAEFLPNDFTFERLYGLIGALNEAMRLYEEGRENQIQVANPASWEGTAFP